VWPAATATSKGPHQFVKGAADNLNVHEQHIFMYLFPNNEAGPDFTALPHFFINGEI
jgi:hypothetical protein